MPGGELQYLTLNGYKIYMDTTGGEKKKVEEKQEIEMVKAFKDIWKLKKKNTTLQ